MNIIIYPQHTHTRPVPGFRGRSHSLSAFVSTAVDRFSEISSQDKSPMSSNMAGRGICFTGRNIKLSGGTPDMSDYKQGKNTGEYKGYNMLQLHDSDLSFFCGTPQCWIRDYCYRDDISQHMG